MAVEVKKKYYEKKCSNCKGKVVYQHKYKPELCPYCNAEYWSKPTDERVLFLLQDKYINTKSVSVLGEMYTPLVNYSRNIIKSKIKNRVLFSEDDLEEKAVDLANEIMKKYLKDKEMLIQYSFGGLMLKIANGILFSNKKEEKHESLNEMYMSERELIDNLEFVGVQESTSHEYLIDDSSKEEDYDSVNGVVSIIDRIANKIRKSDLETYFGLYFLIGFYHKINKRNSSFFDSFFDFTGNKTRDDLQSAELVIHGYLKELQEQG